METETKQIVQRGRIFNQINPKKIYTVKIAPINPFKSRVSVTGGTVGVLGPESLTITNCTGDYINWEVITDE